MIKRLVILLLCSIIIISCSESKSITLNYKTHTFKPVGLFNMDEKNPEIKYNVVAGNVVWSIILCETIIAPIVLLGWYLWEPIRAKSPDDIKGIE